MGANIMSILFEHSRRSRYMCVETSSDYTLLFIGLLQTERPRAIMPSPKKPNECFIRLMSRVRIIRITGLKRKKKWKKEVKRTAISRGDMNSYSRGKKKQKTARALSLSRDLVVSLLLLLHLLYDEKLSVGRLRKEKKKTRGRREKSLTQLGQSFESKLGNLVAS